MKVVRVIKVVVVRAVKDRRVLRHLHSPSFDSFDDESSSAPTSAPTTDPIFAAPTTCEITCNDDVFTINSDGEGEAPYFFGRGDEDDIETRTSLEGDSLVLEQTLYSGDMFLNDNFCGGEPQLAAVSGGTSLFGNTFQLNTGGFDDATIVYEACVDGSTCCSATITVKVDRCGPTLDCPDDVVLPYQCSSKGVSICTCQEIAGSLTFGETCVVPPQYRERRIRGYWI